MKGECEHQTLTFPLQDFNSRIQLTSLNESVVHLTEFQGHEDFIGWTRGWKGEEVKRLSQVEKEYEYTETNKMHFVCG